MMNTIKINNKKYKVKYTLRALFIFEQITGRTFELKTLLDNYVFFYSLILANNGDNILDWNEFIDALDNDPNIFKQINDIVSKSSKIEEIVDSGEEDEKTGEKKN